MTTHLRKVALVVQQVQDAGGLAGDQVDGRLVVAEVDMLPGDPLLAVFALLQLEDVLVEVELQRLVGIVDT